VQLLLRLRPDHAAGVLAGLVEVNLWQIKEAGLEGQTPILDGLIKGSIARKAGFVPDGPGWPTDAIIYKQFDPEEHWKDWDSIRRDKAGDCEDLAPAISAELLASGIPARPVAYMPVPNIWHVIVQYKDAKLGWRYADPSSLGGMEGAA
jgi:hypothetical protein